MRLARFAVRGLLTLGPALAHDDLRVPANVLGRSFVPHRAVLPHAQLVITHAGLGTVMAALAHGVPLVCIPLKNDQYENAARVRASGAGLWVGRHATRRSLRRAILDVLDERRFTDAARRLAGAIAIDDWAGCRGARGALAYVAGDARFPAVVTAAKRETGATGLPLALAASVPAKATSGFEPLYEALQASA